ncbi:MAG TPA: hypothetical protein VE915_01950 [Actinomycetota bacterium]|nr:hypothetical protein [Actinomycetota bacterium]
MRSYPSITTIRRLASALVDDHEGASWWSAPGALNLVGCVTPYDKSEAHHHYDQIAWFKEAEAPGFKPPLRCEGRGGIFDFRPPTPGIAHQCDAQLEDLRHFPL